MTSTKLLLTVHTGLTWIPIEWYAESYNLAVLNNVDNPTWNYKNGLISTIVTHYTYIWHHFNRFHLFLVTYSWFSVEIKFYQIFCFDKKIVKNFIDVLSTCIYIYICSYKILRMSFILILQNCPIRTLNIQCSDWLIFNTGTCFIQKIYAPSWSKE
jgi:hypothetical protein